MGNIAAWGGPLPRSWLSAQLALYQQVLGRMRELGMRVVLPGFAGFVPRAVSRCARLGRPDMLRVVYPHPFGPSRNAPPAIPRRALTLCPTEST